MILQNIEECFNEINAFYENKPCGYPLLVNIDDCSMYKAVLNKMQADSNKKIIRLSEFSNDNKIPNIDTAIEASSNGENIFLIGVAQFCMLQEENKLSELINRLISLSVNGNTAILLNGCKNILKLLEKNDIRLERRIITVLNDELRLPKIYLVKSNEDCYGYKCCNEIVGLIENLESMKYFNGSNNDNIIVVTGFNETIFSHSKYSVKQYGGAFEAISREYPKVKAAIEKDWGSEEQWADLYKNLKKHTELSKVFESKLSATVNLSSFIADKFENTKSIDAWYLWLAMKILNTKENNYLTLAVQKSNSVESLLYNIVFELLKHNKDDKNFKDLYRERRKLVEKMPNVNNLLQDYCNHVGQFEKNAVWYLTDLTDNERLRFLIFINKYDYSNEEITSVTELAFPEIHSYLSKFSFTVHNTAVPSNDVAIYSQLTEYFDEYKMQKLKNKINPEFLDKVNKYAISRPFYKLSPRISIINDIDRNDAQIHFFDALGVEFLSYILDKCSKYDLQATVHIGSCQIPSITSKNLDFKKYFKTVINEEGQEVLPGTKELDELKHHSQIINYVKNPEPIHLFMELAIIDKEIRSIKEMLAGQQFSKILIVSDHGASRLSVIYQSESKLFPNDNGQIGHSGRCCETNIDPNVAEAVYENGFAALANYDRFKGGRKANVEVHGGATLEEMIIPIIEITMKPENENIYIVNPSIEFHNKEIVAITIFSNITLHSPSIVIHELNETSYTCDKSIDGMHYKFEIPEIKRTSSYMVDLYDENKLIKAKMPFKAQKVNVKTKDFF